MDNPQPNAFATGRNPENSAVAVTTGLLNYLSRDEVAGVVAHELAHIKNRDTLIMTITATIAGAISMLAQFGMFFSGNRNNNNGFGIIGTLAMVILAPIAAMLVQMAISRTREYSADKLGAMIQGSPAPLISGLVKISNAAHQIENPSAEQNPATAHMFIINPLIGGHGWDSLFATHPKTENRIAALQQLARGDGRERPVSAGGAAGRAAAVPPAGGSRWQPLGHTSRRPVGLRRSDANRSPPPPEHCECGGVGRPARSNSTPHRPCATQRFAVSVLRTDRGMSSTSNSRNSCDRSA